MGGPYGIIRQTEFFLYSDRDKEAFANVRKKDILIRKSPAGSGLIRMT